MARGSLNVVPMVTKWWREEGLRRPISYIALPVVAGAFVVVFRREVDNLESIFAGTIFLTGFLLSIMFQVHTWVSAADSDASAPIGESWLRERQRRRLRTIGRLYTSLTWAMFVSLALSVAVLVLNTRDADQQRTLNLVGITAAVAVIGTHLVVVLVAVINRLFLVTRATVEELDEAKPGS